MLEAIYNFVKSINIFTNNTKKQRAIWIGQDDVTISVQFNMETPNCCYIGIQQTGAMASNIALGLKEGRPFLQVCATDSPTEGVKTIDLLKLAEIVERHS